MDLDFLDDPKPAPTPEKAEIVQQVNELCICGHPEDAHSGECEILECDCTGYIAGRVADEAVSAVINGAPEVPVPVNVPKAPDKEESKLPVPSVDPLPEGFCQHMCDNPDCLKWWTHGPKQSCKFPDLVKQGLCQKCGGITAELNFDKDFKDGKLTPAGQIKVRNDERAVIREMSIEQLTAHITLLAKQIQEKHLRSLEASRRRAELEEEQLAEIPEHQREEFLQALRRGAKPSKKKSGPKTPKGALQTPTARIAALKSELKAKGKSTEEAAALAGWMVRTGKSLEDAERWLND